MGVGEASTEGVRGESVEIPPERLAPTKSTFLGCITRRFWAGLGAGFWVKPACRHAETAGDANMGHLHHARRRIHV